MKIAIKGLASTYEAEHLARVFFPDARITHGAYARGEAVIVHLTKHHLFCAVRAAGRSKGVLVPAVRCDTRADTEFAVAKVLYRLLCDFTQKKPAWGLLTGVRPVRIVHDLAKEGKSDADIRHVFAQQFDVSAEKSALAHSVAAVQRPVMRQSGPRSYSLYVSIPFCPSRCSYCSFVSRSVKQSKALIPAYLDKLHQELYAIADTARRNRLVLETVYIGGGTPTSISPEELRALLHTVRDAFNIAAVREYTVEAGRPDCTTAEKLEIIKEYGATRISINPQTLSNEVLAAIGRRHSAEDIITCYHAARKAGHDNINMDLIAGLPGDTPMGFRQSLDGVLALSPENITVHTLTLKRASNLVVEKRAEDYADVSQMIDSLSCMPAHGYLPYYLYRQKNTLQNLENTGFTKPGYEGLYNIFIMEEVHTILSAGAGGSTKLVAPAGRIERIFNYKYPHEYLSGFDTILERKKGVDEFYARHLDSETLG